jgi:hypothetical protein
MYNLGTLRHGYVVGNNEYNEFVSATLNLPKTITKIWLYRQIGEAPIITYQDKPLDLDLIPYQEVVAQGLAYGKLIVIPYMDMLEQVHLDIRTVDEVQELNERSGRIMFLKYAHGEDLITYTYNPETKSYTMTEEEEDGKIMVVDNIQPEPFIISLRSIDSRFSRPVWSDGYHLIEDCNKTYHEMMNAQELLRPVVGIPQRLIDSGSRRGEEYPHSLSAMSRIFTVIPGLSDTLDWNYFGGNFNPQPYITTLNMQLANLGQLVGLGKQYLKYESKAPERRTAAEVEYSMNDVFIFHKFLSKQVRDWIRLVTIQVYKAYGQDLNVQELEVEMQDAIGVDMNEESRKLEFDLKQGVIDTEFYLKERYSRSVWDRLNFNIQAMPETKMAIWEEMGKAPSMNRGTE